MTVRKVTVEDNLTILTDNDKPYTFYILKSGHKNCYLLIFEDPFEHSIEIKNKEEIIVLGRKFDKDFSEGYLPI